MARVAAATLAGFLIATTLLHESRQQLHLPLMFQNGAHQAALKGCGGCTLEQAQEVNVAWSYVWHPRSWDVPLLKPGIHVTEEAAFSARRSGWLLWGNEPDLEGPTPEVAASLYPDAEDLDANLALATGSHLDADLSWVRQFWNAYHAQHGHAPRVDALHTHCYFGAESVDECIRHVGNVVQLAQDWGVSEVWVSEFACVPMTARSCYPAAERFIAWMEAEPTVTRYAWFGAFENPRWPWPPELSAGALFDDSGLTAVGRWYGGMR
jgi:hypothetical protein